MDFFEYRGKVIILYTKLADPSNGIVGITVQKYDGAAIRIRTAAVRNAEKIKKEKITVRFGMYCVTVTE